MRIRWFTALFVCLPVLAQDPVVVTIEGTAYRKSEIDSFMRALPAPVFQNFANNKKAFLETMALMVKMSRLAEQEKLHERRPHDARLNYNRWQYLATALINEKDNAASILAPELEKYYEAHKASFASAKTKVLYIAFNNNPVVSSAPGAKKPLNEAQAKEKAAALLKRAKSGEDFAKLIRENSDDAESRAKDGEFPPIRESDQAIPAALKSEIFALKPGEFTQAVQQPNGFYIFRLESLDAPAFPAVKDEIYSKLRKERLDEWVNSVRKTVSLQFNDEKYLAEPIEK